MQISEIFDPYLNYAMFGWISPKGAVKLATPEHARSRDTIQHLDLLADLDLGSENEDAFKKGWIRWYIVNDRLVLECWWRSEVRNAIERGFRNIEILAKTPSKFRHFANNRSGSGQLRNQAHNEMILINSFELETPDGRWSGNSLRSVLNQAERTFASDSD